MYEILLPRWFKRGVRLHYINYPRARFGRGYKTTTKRRIGRSLPQTLLWQESLPESHRLLETEDRRIFTFEGVKTAKTLDGWPSRLRVFDKKTAKSKPRDYAYPPAAIGFVRPDRVAVCIRRKQRREMMHVLGVAGRRGLRPPKYNEFSEIHCD